MAPPPSMAAASDRAVPGADATEASSLRLRRAPSADAGDLADDSSGDRRENGEPQPPQEQQQQHEMLYYRASAPAHRRVKESPLSSDAIFRQSHAGLLNLCIVVLIAVNSRLIIENLMKYGLLIRAGFWFSARSLGDWPLLMCCLTLPVFPLVALMAEKLIRRKLIGEHVVILLHIIITTSVIVYPVVVTLKCDSAVLSGFLLMFLASIMWMKLVSYAHTNYDIRALSKSTEKGAAYGNYVDPESMKDPTFKSLVYFMLAPTLCYQPTYPRTTCIRKGWVTRQLIKCLVFTGLMGFIIEQYINPIVKNSKHPLKGNFLNAIERVLKLSVPTLYVWLCMFYCFFHLWLNILAELLCFGDREFYKDWWNAKTVEEYWRMWNMGVAILVSFLVSAVFHEICIAVPCHIFKFWAFSGIMFQIPLVFLTRYLQATFKNIMVGNMIFWFFFSIVGQPMCVLLYYHDVMNRQAQASR
ncbi:diacylglycerol O-acyltransferase 1-2 isoform X2 [Sorghum bicolor]|uniref:diacylglycerol O-acyltransferase 1-2 isoform X2 n=1 Tax=Sorghum bicolor TaxID=4558 RepID=UPI000B42486E|nr:diacylglycerol O-acyltransferase 1-2 isoform X2 [Sorghum bicolor]|eukprot:XP_021304831.1 diacylglycerol O-acyltransferase 1-2 isoform X2 [Sorghum bicolor]